VALNDKDIGLLNRLTGINVPVVVTLVITLGALTGSVLYAGVAIGQFINRLDHFEELGKRAEQCASVEQCEDAKRRIEELVKRVTKLEWKTGVAN
jgi:hypothetical protein